MYITHPKEINSIKKLIDTTNNVGLNIRLVTSFLYQLLKGMEYINKHKVLHRNLKPQNLLIPNDIVLNIAYFGTCKELHT